jgi:hypothetical protein
VLTDLTLVIIPESCPYGTPGVAFAFARSFSILFGKGKRDDVRGVTCIEILEAIAVLEPCPHQCVVVQGNSIRPLETYRFLYPLAAVQLWTH